jgi:hypothetical protein
MASCCEHSNEPSVSIKVAEILDLVTVSFGRTLHHGVSVFESNGLCFLSAAMCTSFSRSINTRYFTRAT